MIPMDTKSNLSIHLACIGPISIKFAGINYWLVRDSFIETTPLRFLTIMHREMGNWIKDDI